MKRLKTFVSIEKLRAHLAPFRLKHEAIGLVPTMGALHAGHLSLVKRATRECGQVVVSIFVNPTQFGPTEDFKKYPRNLNKDLALLGSLGKELCIFAPSVETMYPTGSSTIVEVQGTLTSVLEGAFRPNHFRGVASVVAKLFEIAQPQRAYFGLKDYQQYCVVRRMVKDLCMPLEIFGCPTQREKDGLAMSSRNQYLNSEERAKAPAIYAALQSAAQLIKGGERQAARVEQAGRQFFKKHPSFKLDYFSVRKVDTLEEMRQIQGPAVLLCAARLGKIRLIDNLVVQGRE